MKNFPTVTCQYVCIILGQVEIYYLLPRILLSWKTMDYTESLLIALSFFKQGWSIYFYFLNFCTCVVFVDLLLIISSLLSFLRLGIDYLSL